MWIERAKLTGLKRWLESQGYTLYEPCGDFEIMRWSADPGEPMPILYRSEKSKLITVGKGAQDDIHRWLNWKMGTVITK